MASQVLQHKQASNRFFLIDLLKAISIIAVISYHSVLVPRSTYENSELLLEILFAPLRFCVPILLTISFILLEYSFVKNPHETGLNLLKKRLFRLAIPTFFWFSLMAILKAISGNSLVEIAQSALRGTLFTGSYYLLIMFQLIPIFIAIRHWLENRRNAVAVVLAQGFVFLLIYAALISASGNQVISILKAFDRPPFIYWFGYIALGTIFYKNFSSLKKISLRIPVWTKLLALILIFAGLIAETSLLFRLTAGSAQPLDYAMISSILSVPVLIILFASIDENKLTAPIKLAIQTLSRYSLGIFCINGILSQLFLSFGSKLFSEMTFNFSEILAIKLAGWALLLGLSLGLSVLLDRIGLKAVVC